MTYNYIERGEGRPVLMLHGMFGHASNWRETMDRLSPEYRTIALELPYLGLGKDDCNVKYFSDFVLGFADSKGLSNAVYMGNSLGGHVALELAINNGGRVGGLVLTGSSGLFERSYEKDLQIHPTRAYIKRKVSEIFFDKSQVTDELVDEVHRILLNRRNKLRIVRLSKSAKSYNVKDGLHRIGCPTLLVWGAEDTITPPAVALDFKKLIKNSRLEFIENCCHAPMMERPDKFGEIVAEFLAARL